MTRPRLNPAPSSRAAPSAIALPADIAIDGCVLDERGEPRPGRPVRAIDAQGGLLAQRVPEGPQHMNAAGSEVGDAGPPP